LHNKADLLASPGSHGAGQPGNAALPDDAHLLVSARTGLGLDALHTHLRGLAQHGGEVGEGTFTARARHVDALRQAQTELAAARGQLEAEALDLAAESLRHTHEALGEITGHVRADDLLGHIFSSFCIGK
jgi:tRNA modification GTPase